MFKRSKVKLSLLLFCILVLVAIVSGCKSIFPAKEGQANKIIKVLIVEFGTGTPIPNMKVDIKDAETNKLVKEYAASDDGEVDISGLEVGKKYLFVPSSIYATDAESSTGVAQIVDIEQSTNYVRLETYYVRDRKGVNVPVVLQEPLFPHGCEIAALTSVLKYYGAEVTIQSLVDEHLPKQEFERTNNQWIGPDPAKKYAGNPAAEDGTYAFAPVIEQAAKSYIKKSKTSLKVENLTGASEQQILKKISQGVPVITWVTLDLSAPKMKEGWTIAGTDEQITMYRNLHVVVVTGYENGKIIVMDPLKGYVAHDKDAFFKNFKEMKSQAIVLEK